MPDIEDFLDDEDEPKTEKKDAAFAQMRKALKEAEKRAEEAEGKVQEFTQMQRAITIQETAQKLGINPKHAAFYPVDKEAEPEAIKSWAVEMELLKAAEGEEVDDTPEPEAGFTPTVIAEASMVGSKMYSVEEFEKLVKMDPRKAEAIYKAGRLEKPAQPWSVGQPLTFKGPND